MNAQESSTRRMNHLSKFCYDPKEAYRRMRHSVQTASRYLSKVIARNMFSRLRKLKIGTNEVEATAKRVQGNNRPRCKKEVVRVLNKRILNVQRNVKSLRYELFKTRNQVKQCIGQDCFKEYYKIEKTVRSDVWKSGNIRMNKKIDFLVQKRMKQQREIDLEKQSEYRKYYKISDVELETVKEDVLKEQYVVYGDILLNESEKKCLNLGPKYMVTPNLNNEDFEVEVEMEAVKTRMELHKQVEIKNGEQSEKEINEKDRKSREIFDSENGTLQMSKMRVTDAKYNVRSYPPREVDVDNEIKIQYRRDEFMSTFAKVKRDVCDKKGRPISKNLSDEELKGQISLTRKVKEGEIIITTTDKSGKFAVVEPELYKQAAMVHIKDNAIDQKTVSETEKLLNRHSNQIIKALRMGTKHGKNGQVERIKQAYTSVNAKPGPIYFLVKDHKSLKEGEKIPPTRPVCSAKGGPGARLSNLISQLLNSAADAANAQTECMSTEEAMNKILKTNRSMAEKMATSELINDEMDKAVILSMDVKALYPSLRVQEVSPILYNMLIKLQNEERFSIVDIDYHEVGKYLAIVCSEEEIRDKKLMTAIPKKATGTEARGRKPGPAYWESDMIEIKRGEELVKVQKWTHAKEPSEQQKQRMLALMITKAAITSMGNHTYRFNGTVYKQQDGGPIGDELSQAIARLVMIWWDEEFLKKCKQLEIDIEMYIRYVDDTNIVTIPQKLGIRYKNGALVYSREAEEEDKQQDRDRVAASLLKNIADEIVPMLKFEEDVCSKYDDGKLPILDLKVWMEVIENENSSKRVMIRHEFYKKPMANQNTLLASTAYPNSQMRAIMVEEVLRRLRNCDPDTTWQDRGQHLTKFAKELKSSGHNEHFREIVFQKAVNKFVMEHNKHKEGIKDIYRTREDRQRDMKEKGGKCKRDNWYKNSKEPVDGRQEATSVIKVPYSCNSVLKKSLQDSAKKCKPPENTQTRIVESGGSKLKNILIKPDPFPKMNCGRSECSSEDCREQCYQGHINYTITCVTCESKCARSQNNDDDETKNVYLGESSRGAFVRFGQHKAAYKAKKGFMWEHAEDAHDGKSDVEFVIKVDKKDSDPMRRVIRESIRIKNARTAEEEGTRDNEGRKTKLLNTKNEYFGMKLVKMNPVQE